MQAEIGDVLIISSSRITRPERAGEIVEVMLSGDSCSFRVRWADGRESVVFPGADAKIVERAERRIEPRSVETRVVMIELVLNEDRETCDARATMRTSTGTFSGTGSARRNPSDPLVPMIGEELAAARSLAHLAATLEDAARAAIATHENRPLHLV